MPRIFAPDFPFNPGRWPFFYGWVIVAAGTFGVVISIPGQTMGVSVFTDFLIESLGLSRVEISTAYMLGTIGSGLLLPWGGRMFDRFGARAMIVFSCLALAAVLAFMSQSGRAASWLAGFVGEGRRAAAGFAVILGGFLFLRFAGQGMVAMTSRAMLGKWFNRKRGKVSGISGIVVTVVFASAPILLNAIVVAFSWRGAWLAMSGFMVFAAFLCWLFYRDNPEECGLAMDGGATGGNGSGPNDAAEEPEREWTAEEACATYAFWVFNLGIAVQALILTAVTFHIVSLGEQVGLDRDEALFIFLPMSAVSLIATFAFGRVSGRVPLKTALMAMMGFLAASVAGIPHLDTWAGYAVAVIGFGGSNGIFVPLMVVVWPDFFGRKHLGAISSLNMSATVFASALGPFIFGLSYEWYQSYNAGIYACMAMPLLLMIAAVKADKPGEPETALTPGEALAGD